MERQRIWIIAAALSAQAGCVGIHPEYDSRAGEAVVAARAMQTLNPGGTNVNVVPGIDGRPAKETMDRYVESFKAPPPTVNVLNIGGSLNDGGGNR